MFIINLFFILFLCERCFSDLYVVRSKFNLTVTVMADLPALFGPPLPLGGLKGLLVYSNPEDGCSLMPKPPQIDGYEGDFIALVRRFNCSFVEKVLHAQYAGYAGVIVRNVGSNSVEEMSGNKDTSLIHIPSVFIGQDDGIILQTDFQFNSGFYVWITDDIPFNIQTYLLPFAITVGICFILMLTFILVKCVRDYRRSRRHRLSSRALRKLPIHKFKKGDPYDCCAVCLDDYVDNDKLRVLPCSHAYHSKCIDHWLTKNRRICPICKRKVIAGDERPSDIETDSEDESAPLVRSSGRTQGGTFTEQRENPFEVAQRQASSREGNATQYHRFHDEDVSDSDSDDSDLNVRRVKSDQGDRLTGSCDASVERYNECDNKSQDPSSSHTPDTNLSAENRESDGTSVNVSNPHSTLTKDDHQDCIV